MLSSAMVTPVRVWLPNTGPEVMFLTPDTGFQRSTFSARD